MILCVNGHANPDGATYCAVCKVYIDSSAQAPAPAPPEAAPTLVTVAPSSLSVGAAIAGPPPQAALSAELTPQTSKGRTAGSHLLALHNPGSTPLTIAPTAAAPDGALSVEIQPPNLTIAPGESATARVRVRAQKPHWLGRRHIHPFRLIITPDLALDGTMIQQARIPAWLPLALIAALAALVAFLATRGNSHGTCGAAQLAAQELDSGGAAGTIVASITLKNVSSASCALEGYAGLQLQDAGGSPLPTNVVHGGLGFLDRTPSRVSLASGGDGTLLIAYHDVPSGTEECPTATTLLIRPPGASDSIPLSINLIPCGGRIFEAPILAGAVHAQ